MKIAQKIILQFKGSNKKETGFCHLCLELIYLY